MRYRQYFSANRYIPYTSGKYRGKRYIYLKEIVELIVVTPIIIVILLHLPKVNYEELDFNDIYVPGCPKYKTLIEVLPEPSGINTTASGKNIPRNIQNDIQNDDIPSNKFSDNEWNTLKDDFISQYLPNTEPNNNYRSGDIPFNTQPNTLYFDKPQEKPFITSMHDRDLHTGEEISYSINMVNGMNDIPINRDNKIYSGIDLINDALNGDYDIYDEVLKRKDYELFGTNHPNVQVHIVLQKIQIVTPSTTN
ncbi:hypothetical protein PFHG_05576 [Plasmodium falciparum HB3]|uniref:Plasmodium falciparum erythrocyte membrane protein 1 acidic terminal segment domain-containing protein n=1 Tax=Plasmodium falciparum (isolate HB3) TaxID=137071 RepID=A0A0L7KLT4_PLAFX|nr:hypothetical protein PFHG_05576 [Plasmodium falciparum HB3]